jgi:hypothetical protein
MTTGVRAPLQLSSTPTAHYRFDGSSSSTSNNARAGSLPPAERSIAGPTHDTHTSSDDRSFAGVAPDPNPPPASMHTEAARGNLGAVQQLVESESPARRKVR